MSSHTLVCQLGSVASGEPAMVATSVFRAQGSRGLDRSGLGAHRHGSQDGRGGQRDPPGQQLHFERHESGEQHRGQYSRAHGGLFDGERSALRRPRLTSLEAEHGAATGAVRAAILEALRLGAAQRMRRLIHWAVRAAGCGVAEITNRAVTEESIYRHDRCASSCTCALPDKGNDASTHPSWTNQTSKRRWLIWLSNTCFEP